MANNSGLCLKGKETDPHLMQGKDPERRRASDKGERASKRQRTSDIEVCGPPAHTRVTPWKTKNTLLWTVIAIAGSYHAPYATRVVLQI